YRPLPSRVPSRYAQRARRRGHPPRHRRVQRLYLGVAHDRWRPWQRDPGAAHLHVRPGLQVPRLWLRERDLVLAHRTRARGVCPAVLVDPQIDEGLTMVISPRRRKWNYAIRYLLLAIAAFV